MKNEQPKHWLEIAKRISSIAQTGLAFTNDKFDKERYFELQKLSIEILEHITEIETDKLEFIFNRDIGYQTPKVGIRAVVIEKDKLLFVREKMDNKWSLPGGYADIGMTPSQIAINEVKEESGYDVEPIRILGFIDYNKYQERQFPFDIYQLFMECKIIGGNPVPGLETSEVGFFDIENLPELSTRRVTRDQILTMFDLCQNSELAPIFD